MATKLGSFRASLAERRERLLSGVRGISDLNFGEERQPTIRDKVHNFAREAKVIARKGYELGRNDPRVIAFAAKNGLALMVLTLIIFLEPVPYLSQHSVWAIITVVVTFEFSIGATFSKGINRGIGTILSGAIALGVGELAQVSGSWEALIIMLSMFVVGFVSSYIKMYPTMKPYEYGFRVFSMTYCIIMVSGHRSRVYAPTILNRLLLIAFGATVGLVINVLIYPIWAGEDLHKLVSQNFGNVASSLECCVKEYLNCLEYSRIPSKILTYQASDDPIYKGYRSAVEASSKEEALMGFAIWEPPHGKYKSLKYPWKSYVRVSGALRHCAFMVMALHGCILSEIQAPAERRQVFQKEMQRVGMEGARVLRLLGEKVKKMEKLGEVDILLGVHEAAEELQSKVDKKSYVLVNAERWEVGKVQETLEISDDEAKFNNLKITDDEAKFNNLKITDDEAKLYHLKITNSSSDVFMKQMWWPSRLSFNGDIDDSHTYESASALSLATFASLLIEFVARLQNLVDSFNDLADKANFHDPSHS